MFERLVVVGWLGGLVFGCASAPAPVAWYSASCDMRAELRGAPVSAREVAETAFGQLVMTTHRAEHEGEIRVFGCRQVPMTWLNRVGAKVAATEALGVDAAGLGEGWTRLAHDDEGPVQSQTFQGPKGQKAWLRARAEETGRILGDVIITASEEVARAYRQSVSAQDDEAAFTPASLVRSAECLSGAPMPAWPVGAFDDGVATLIHGETKDRLERVWQLRCVILGDALKARGASSLFAEAVEDTVVSGAWTVVEQHDGELDGHGYRDLTFVSQDGSAVMMARLVFDGERLHLVTFTTGADGALGEPQRAAAVREGTRFREALVLFGR